MGGPVYQPESSENKSEEGPRIGVPTGEDQRPEDEKYHAHVGAVSQGMEVLKEQEEGIDRQEQEPSLAEMVQHEAGVEDAELHVDQEENHEEEEENGDESVQKSDENNTKEEEPHDGSKFKQEAVPQLSQD